MDIEEKLKKHNELVDKFAELLAGQTPDQAICALICMLVQVSVARGYDNKEFIQCVSESLSESYADIRAQGGGYRGEELH